MSVNKIKNKKKNSSLEEFSSDLVKLLHKHGFTALDVGGKGLRFLNLKNSQVLTYSDLKNINSDDDESEEFDEDCS